MWEDRAIAAFELSEARKDLAMIRTRIRFGRIHGLDPERIADLERAGRRIAARIERLTRVAYGEVAA